MGASSEAHKFDKVAEQNKLKEKSAVKPQQKYNPPPPRTLRECNFSGKSLEAVM